jgi:MerR family copper efflux transcriptional regulator
MVRLMTPLTVSDLARQAGVSPHTVRYYDRVGLLSTADRSPSGYRLHPPDLVERLRFIRGAKSLGLQLQHIALLLDVMDRGPCPCGLTEALLRGRLAATDEEVASLSRLRDELERLLDTHPATACPHEDAGTWWCRNDFARRS